MLLEFLKKIQIIWIHYLYCLNQGYTVVTVLLPSIAEKNCSISHTGSSAINHISIMWIGYDAVDELGNIMQARLLILWFNQNKLHYSDTGHKEFHWILVCDNKQNKPKKKLSLKETVLEKQSCLYVTSLQ